MTQLGTRDLVLTIASTDVSMEVTNVRITAGDADGADATFAEARAGGGRLYKLAFTARQDPATGTMWDKVWTMSGSTVAAVIKPAGGTTVDATHPSFTGNVVITEPDGDFLGGAADASSTNRWTFDCEWNFTAKPVRAVS